MTARTDRDKETESGRETETERKTERETHTETETKTESFTTIYCMKPPNIKAPKCTLFSIQYSALFSRVKGHKGSLVLPRLLRALLALDHALVQYFP